MYAYELLPKLTHLTLVGQDEDGELEFVGTAQQWNLASKMEEDLCGLNQQ